MKSSTPLETYPLTPAIYQAMVLRSALKLYRDHKIRANTAYTPKAMLSAAFTITGTQRKLGQYDLAIQDLTNWLEAQR